MNLREAKIELREHGYRVYKPRLVITEATDGKGLLGQIKNVLKKFKKEADGAKDKEAKKEVAQDLKDFKEEMEDNGKVKSIFRDNPKIIKYVFGAMAILMLSMGATQSHAAAMTQTTLGGGNGAQAVMTMDGGFDSAMNNLQHAIDGAATGDGDKGGDGANEKEADGPSYKPTNIHKLAYGNVANFIISVDEDGDGHADRQMVIDFKVNGETGESHSFQIGSHSYDNLDSLQKAIGQRHPDLFNAIHDGCDQTVDYAKAHGQLSYLK